MKVQGEAVGDWGELGWDKMVPEKSMLRQMGRASFAENVRHDFERSAGKRKTTGARK